MNKRITLMIKEIKGLKIALVSLKKYSILETTIQDL